MKINNYVSADTDINLFHFNAIYSCSNPHTRASRRTWEVSEEPDDVGGRFEKAYLRIDRGAGCSCAEMIYMVRNTHMLSLSLSNTHFQCCCIPVLHTHSFLLFHMFTSNVISNVCSSCSPNMLSTPWIWPGTHMLWSSDVSGSGWLWKVVVVTDESLKIPPAHWLCKSDPTTPSHQSPLIT